MKFNSMKKILLVLLALVCVLSLAACTPTLEEKDGKLIDKKSGVTYAGAPLCFEPIKLTDEPFAKASSSKVELFEIEGLETRLWISEPYDGIGGVWYNEAEITLPTLDGFAPNIVYVCVEQNITVALGQIDKQEDVDAIVSAFTEGEAATIVTEGTSYKLKFASDSYPGLYYSLLYIEGDDGGNYIYDRSTKTCVDVGDVLLEYMPR